MYLPCTCTKSEQDKWKLHEFKIFLKEFPLVYLQRYEMLSLSSGEENIRY